MTFQLLRFQLIRPLAASMLWLAGSGMATAGTVNTPACQRDLLVIDSELKQGQARLVTTQESQKRETCAIWRQHVDLARRAGATFRRCKTDTERRVMSADMDTQVQDFEAAIAATCKGL